MAQPAPHDTCNGSISDTNDSSGSGTFFLNASDASQRIIPCKPHPLDADGINKHPCEPGIMEFCYCVTKGLGGRLGKVIVGNRMPIFFCSSHPVIAVHCCFFGAQGDGGCEIIGMVTRCNGNTLLFFKSSRGWWLHSR